jgi:hypothetical protein
MRKVVCEQCQRPFLENDMNPNVHYSSPETICLHCKSYNVKQPSEWYQDSTGEYKQK